MHNDYAGSKIKEAVEAYAASKGMMNDLDTVDGYKIRLIKYDELIDLGYKSEEVCTGSCYQRWSNEDVPTWVYSGYGEGQNYVAGYWTMTPNANAASSVWRVYSGGFLNYSDVDINRYGVRPVINLLKSNI